MLLAIISIGIFVVPIVIGVAIFVVGLIMLFASKKKPEIKKYSIVVTAAGFATAAIPAGILAAIILTSEAKTRIEYNSLPGKNEVDITMDKEGFMVEGEYYKRLPYFKGRLLPKESTGITLVDGVYCHYPFEKIVCDCPYELYYAGMFDSTYCRESEYEKVLSFYNEEADTDTLIRDVNAGINDYNRVDINLKEYNELYYRYYPYGLYASLNEQHMDSKGIVLEGDYSCYEIQTISKDEVYETQTRVLYYNDDFFLIYRKLGDKAYGIKIDGEDAAFYDEIVKRGMNGE